CPAVLLGQEGAVTFEKHVRPILKAQCFECHGEGKKLRGGLDLRLRHLIEKGGDSGAAMLPGNAKESLLLKRVVSHEMPPGKKKLTKDEIATLERWLQQGAKATRPEPKELPLGFSASPDEMAHWAFQPIVKTTPLPVKAVDRVSNPIDAFILTAL